MSVPAAPWVDGLTFGQVLDETVQRYPDRDALVFPQCDLQLSYREFLERVDAAARGLLALGIRPGDHVAVWATNVPEWVILQFATARIGSVMVTINPSYRPFELQYVLRQSDSVALFLVDQFKSSDYFAMLKEVCPELAASEPGNLKASEFPRLRHVVAIKGKTPAGAFSWEEMLRRGASVEPDRVRRIGDALKASDPINIQYTSGTTGFPKAAMLSHRNLLLNAYYIGERQRLTHEDRICIPGAVLPLLRLRAGNARRRGLRGGDGRARRILPADGTLDAIEKCRATSIYGVPTMFIAELEDPTFAGRDLSSLRTGIMAGSPCPIEVMKRVIRDMGAREMTIAYGQTETSPVVTQTGVDDPLDLRVETVGRPLPGVEIKVVDPVDGRELGDNEQGELCSRGHVVMLGYYNNSEATAAAIDQDGWLHSGDLAVRLPSGYYKITGRIKDMVIRGGENIYPREIEEFLFTHPAVEQSAVCGVPDPKYGEELCAWIKLKQGAQVTDEEIRDYCRSKLARFKVPRYVRFVESFPQTVTGKIQKFKIRERMIDELGLTEEETA
jgi:fatty-acyl-CoA synthase